MKFFIAPFLFLIPSLLYSQESDQVEDNLIRKSIFFGGGSYFIDDFQKEELSLFLNDIEDIKTYEIVIFSHTDNIGGKEYNEWLSMMRSEAVIDQLIINGIPRNLTEIRDFGQANPLYTNQSTGGRMMNRRVDIILVPITF